MRILYDLLRGAGALVEGVEFLVAHHTIARRLAGHFLVAAACVLITTQWLPSRLQPLMPAVTPLVLPWYLVLAEWAWSGIPSVLAQQAAGWAAMVAYLGIAPPRGLVALVAERRGGDLGARPVSDRMRSTIWLALGGVVCFGLSVLPTLGPLVALLAVCPVVGGALFVSVSAGRVGSSSRHRWWSRGLNATSIGLGGAVFVALSIPVVNLVALPCAATGAACLVIREERTASPRSAP